MLQGIQDVVLEQLLIRNAHLYRLSRRTMLTIPVFDQWNIQRSTGETGTTVEWPGRPQQRNAVCRIVRIQRPLLLIDTFIKRRLKSRIFIAWRRGVDWSQLTWRRGVAYSGNSNSSLSSGSKSCSATSASLFSVRLCEIGLIRGSK